MSIQPPDFIRINDAVQRFSLSRSTFNRALAAGELTRIKRGGAVLLDAEEVRRWVLGDVSPADAQTDSR